MNSVDDFIDKYRMYLKSLDTTYYCSVCRIHNREKKCVMCGSTHTLDEYEWKVCKECNNNTIHTINGIKKEKCFVCGGKCKSTE